LSSSPIALGELVRSQITALAVLPPMRTKRRGCPADSLPAREVGRVRLAGQAKTYVSWEMHPLLLTGQTKGSAFFVHELHCNRGNSLLLALNRGTVKLMVFLNQRDSTRNLRATQFVSSHGTRYRQVKVCKPADPVNREFGQTSVRALRVGKNHDSNDPIRQATFGKKFFGLGNVHRDPE